MSKHVDLKEGKKYYNPKTKNFPKIVIMNGKICCDVEGCTHINDMPGDAKKWFTSNHEPGYRWVCKNGIYPMKEKIPGFDFKKMEKQKTEKSIKQLSEIIDNSIMDKGEKESMERQVSDLKLKLESL